MFADVCRYKVKSHITMITSSEHLGSNESSHAAFLHSDFLLFCVCSKQLHPVSRAPDNLPFCTFKTQEAPNSSSALKCCHVVSWERYLHIEHCPSWSGPLPVVGNQKDLHFTTVQGRGAQKRKIQHESHVTKWLLDAWKDSIPSESHVRNCHSNPGANPTALHARWLGPLPD